ncbi:hypothetical protein SYNPS1DRAFT_30847 [Syncephalis pseudoplumigaleata]|uniref:Uncharacterized protein n=1 Tax=Syncephalis pseudoplumigaleata TaxID=1712513 RepID=A0A4P9YVH3_9FUNG|nr:hypothetical protein SYNPS1DRAFT_30847 [Syncephalis pseudoplumigaleata]|eukprot:RKP23412.1 hypothetical protein SYNPS1DRAFT_30847 [Syncephalis pseudoplumigaleata]
MAWYITGYHRHRRQQRRQFRLALGLLLLCWAGLSWLIWELLPLDDGYVSRWAASPKTKSSSAASHDPDHRPAPPAARAYPSESLRALLGALAPYPLAMANESQAGEVPPTCELVHFQLLARDGTHYPSAIEQADFDALETALRVHASAEWPAWLREWQSPAYPPEQLTGQGRQELAQLAQRDVKRYRRWLHSLAYERHRNAWYASAAMPR